MKYKKGRGGIDRPWQLATRRWGRKSPSNKGECHVMALCPWKRGQGISLEEPVLGVSIRGQSFLRGSFRS